VFRYNCDVCIRSVRGVLTVDQCSFIDNTTWGGVGAAINADYANVSNCIFKDNLAGEGAGICGAALIRDGTIVQSHFVSNAAYMSGGALSTGGLVEDCVFAGNGWCRNTGALGLSGTARRCVFSGNYADSAPAIGFSGEAVIEDCTIVANNAAAYTDCISGWGGTLTIRNSIIAFNGGHSEGPLIRLENGASATLHCTDIYGNEFGDWTGSIADQLGVNGNISADPLFCDFQSRDLYLHSTSPCAPENSGGCGLIGLYGVACDPSSVEMRSWGKIRGMYR
jgi:hypothetical protein